MESFIRLKQVNLTWIKLALNLSINLMYYIYVYSNDNFGNPGFDSPFSKIYSIIFEFPPEDIIDLDDFNVCNKV